MWGYGRSPTLSGATLTRLFNAHKLAFRGSFSMVDRMSQSLLKGQGARVSLLYGYWLARKSVSVNTIWSRQTWRTACMKLKYPVTWSLIYQVFFLFYNFKTEIYVVPISHIILQNSSGISVPTLLIELCPRIMKKSDNEAVILKKSWKQPLNKSIIKEQKTDFSLYVEDSWS
jgi:hypothetical protein